MHCRDRSVGCSYWAAAAAAAPAPTACQLNPNLTLTLLLLGLAQHPTPTPKQASAAPTPTSCTRNARYPATSAPKRGLRCERRSCAAVRHTGLEPRPSRQGAWWGFTSRSCEEIDTDSGVCEASQSAPRRRLELRQAQSCRYDNYAYTLLDAMVRWGARGARLNLTPAPEPGPEPDTDTDTDTDPDITDLNPDHDPDPRLAPTLTTDPASSP
eukprot:scaffold87888_cov57-Phaeocystis_antarctica.AAC.2